MRLSWYVAADLLEATELSARKPLCSLRRQQWPFLRALDRYIDDALTRLDSELIPEKCLAGVRICLAGYVDRTSGSAGKRGCLVVATAMELAADDPEVEQRIRRLQSARNTGWPRQWRAPGVGRTADGVEPRTAARLLIWLVEGMRVVGKTGWDRTTSKPRSKPYRSFRKVDHAMTIAFSSCGYLDLSVVKEITMSPTETACAVLVWLCWGVQSSSSRSACGVSAAVLRGSALHRGRGNPAAVRRADLQRCGTSSASV